MSESVSVLLDNALLLVPGLLLVIVGVYVLSRLSVRLAELLRPRLSEEHQELLETRWLARVSRISLQFTTLLSVLFLAAVVLLSWYEINLLDEVVAWGQRSVLADPLAALWRTLKIVGAIVGAILAHFLVVGVLRLLAEALQSSNLSGRREQAMQLLDRIQVVLRRVISFGAVWLVARFVAVPLLLTEYFVIVAYVAVGFAIARALVSAGHLASDMLFGIAASLADTKTPLRYVSRLQHLAGISKRALEYLVYVGSATWIFDQVQPDTWFGQAGRIGIRVIAIVYLSRVFVEVCEAALREMLATRNPDHTDAEHQQRLTLAPLITSVLRYGVYFSSAVMAMSEFGIDTTPILAGAGLLGIAVGLGAQAVVGDIVSGFFILFEGVFLVGDRVQIGEVLGFVEEIGVRVTRIRDEAGVVHFVPNGEIRTVASHSRIYVNAVVEFNVPYDADLGQVLAAVQGCFEEARANHSEITGESEWVIEDLRESSVLIRTMTRVKPGQDENMSEILRAALLTALIPTGIQPQAHTVVKVISARPEVG